MSRGTNDDPLRIRQFGVQRSGTNVTKRLIEENVPRAEVVEDGKHGPFLEDDADGYVLTVKEPWAWLQSYERWRTHDTWGSPRRLWYRFRGRSMEHYDARHRLVLYANALAGWMRALPEPLAVVQYRDLLTRREEVLGGLQDALDLPSVDLERVDVVDARLKPGGEPADASFDPTYYTQRRYLDEYHPTEIRSILDDVSGSMRFGATFEVVGMDLRGLLEDPDWRGFPGRPKL